MYSPSLDSAGEDVPIVMLVDNGSTRPESTINLRRLAEQLGTRARMQVHAVSLQHADQIDPCLLEGEPAHTFRSFIRQRLEQGGRSFIVLPLFFGMSRALTALIPRQAAELTEHYGPFDLRLADVLCPLPAGEPQLARILCDNLEIAARGIPSPEDRIVLVDHGSPIPQVSAVKHRLAEQMRQCLGAGRVIDEAVMERRSGKEYDFNGRLLADVLKDAGSRKPDARLLLSLLFLNPGRHAGAGGDIETICAGAVEEFPGLRIAISPLVGQHPGLADILYSRLQAALTAPPAPKTDYSMA